MIKKSLKITLALLTASAALFIYACNNSGNTSAQEKVNEHHHVYACPMHPEVTGKEGDTCPKCGMPLEHADESKTSGHYQMQFTSVPETPEAGKIVSLSFIPKNNDNANAPVALDVEHEKKIHLIVVNEDLSWFHHIHPEYQADGHYTVNETFPFGGNYFLYADYKPTGGEEQHEKIKVSVQGKTIQPTKWGASNLISTTDGYEVRFVNGAEMKSGLESHLVFSIYQNGKPIQAGDLEKYLGMNAHIVMISAAEKEYYHVHSEENEYPIHAHAVVSKPGIYRVWMQFQTQGKVHTANFTVNVAQGDSKNAKTEEHHHEHGH